MPWLMAVAVLIAAGQAPRGQAEAKCGPPIEREHTVCQRCYERLDNERFARQVYAYVPDIESKVFGGFSPFTLWIVEGVYGPPFLNYGGTFDPAKFDQLSKTSNVVATPIPVDKNLLGKARAFKVGKDTFRIEPVRVNTSYGGTDTVTLKICR